MTTRPGEIYPHEEQLRDARLDCEDARTALSRAWRERVAAEEAYDKALVVFARQCERLLVLEAEVTP